jgi:hypothetical protein
MKIIHCPTKKEFIAVVKVFKMEGICFGQDKIKLIEGYWEHFKENTCVDSYGKELYFGSIDFYKEEFPRTKITEAKDFLKPEIPLWRKLKEFRFKRWIKGSYLALITPSKSFYTLSDDEYKQLANYIKKVVLYELK